MISIIRSVIHNACIIGHFSPRTKTEFQPTGKSNKQMFSLAGDITSDAIACQAAH